MRGLYSGGTFRSEAELLWRDLGLAHTAIDLGDDEFTVGRPHPMIDHSTRIERIAQEARDPSTAAIVLDVVLGFGAHDDPAGALAPAVAHAKAACAKDGRHLSVVAFVCGTEEDPQRLSVQQATLREAGALVLPGSTAAARLAGEIGRARRVAPGQSRRARVTDMTRPRRIVIAFGGNASYPPTIKGLASEQFALMAQACRHLVRIIQSGYQLVLTHGNGPVVGNILFRMAKTATELPPMPMDVCVAHSQGGMGYMLQQTLVNVLREEGVAMGVSGIITQVEVNANDPGFSNPTKPVGRFFCQEDADRLAREHGWHFVEDAGRGYRRVVPSPEPVRIVEIPAVEALLSANVIPIACGGGGIPVARDAKGALHGVSAVIDKDLTSAMLASELGAQTLLMLTGVDRVALDFGKPTQRALDRLPASEARRHLAAGQFPPGSMGPKIAAALRYLDHGGGETIITSLDRAHDALAGRAGTRIVS